MSSGVNIVQTITIIHITCVHIISWFQRLISGYNVIPKDFLEANLAIAANFAAMLLAIDAP